MANRRMFSKTITSSSQFLMMPPTSRLLYYDLGMGADDDGFAEHFTIMKMTDASPDDLRVLSIRGFIKVFDDKVLIILDWKENNYLRNDRYTPSKYLEIYKEELKQISSGIPNGDQMATQVRLGKVRLGKERENIFPPQSSFKEIKPAEINSASPLKDKLINEIPMSLQEFMDYCKKSPQRHIQIIGEWAEAIEPNYTTKGQWQSFIKRNVRPASDLIPYTEKQLQEAFKKIENDLVKIDNNGKKVGFITKYTLETLLKYV